MSKAELCPEAMVEVKELACRVREHGGAALVADYGGLGNDRHTLRVSQPLSLPPSLPLSLVRNLRFIACRRLRGLYNWSWSCQHAELLHGTGSSSSVGFARNDYSLSYVAFIRGSSNTSSMMC